MKDIYVFGDSVAQGIVQDDSGKYHVSRVGCVRLLKRSGYPIRNYAIHGYTVLQGLEAFEKTPSESGAVCVIEFGGNDCDLAWDEVEKEPQSFHDGKIPLLLFQQSLERFVREARGRGMEPILMTPIPLMSRRYFRHVSQGRDGNRILAYLREDPESISRWQERYATAVRQVAESCDCRLADMRSWMLEEFDYPSLICADGIHPNEAGQKIIAEMVLRQFPLATL